MNQEPSATNNEAPKRKRGNPNFYKGMPAPFIPQPRVLTAQELLNKQIKADLKAVARDHAPEAFNFLVRVLRDENANTKDRMNAATQILDRGFGKVTHHTEVKVDVYDKLSDIELIKLISGKEVNEEQLQAQRESMLIEHEPTTE